MRLAKGLLRSLGLLDPGAEFEFREIPAPDEAVRKLFRTSFRAEAPDFPRHYVARHRRSGATLGYVHYTEHSPGVYLVGGLCVDTAAYRRLTSGERAHVRREGSISRWLSNRSIALLPDKRAVFGYTGNRMSQRDADAIGFVRLEHPHLIVQWHAMPEEGRAALVAQVAQLGPF